MSIERFAAADPALYADMEAYLKSGEWEIAHESQTALWLRWNRGWLHAIAAFDLSEARRILEQILSDGAIVLRGCEGLRELAAARGFNGCNPCVQVMYDRKEAIPIRTELVIRHPDESDFPKVAESYDMGTEEELWEDFHSPDFLGAYLDGEFVGYIGVHGEGSMGILYVFPTYRRRGYAEALYATLINRQLEKGRLPFAQILEDNEQSVALQRKMGLRISDGRVYWMWRKEDDGEDAEREEAED